MGAAPKWATELLERVCSDRGAEVPELTWRRAGKRRYVIGARTTVWSRPVCSSGRYYSGEHRIVVTAGSMRTDQRLVLLHEIAHALTPGQHHNETFWMIAWQLYRAYKVPMRHAKVREDRYRVGSVVGRIAARSADREFRAEGR